MLATVAIGSNRRRHVDDSFDQLCFLQVRHGFVPALELGARQTVALFQRWDCRG
jgi:hypothetical protein